MTKYKYSRKEITKMFCLDKNGAWSKTLLKDLLATKPVKEKECNCTKDSFCHKHLKQAMGGNHDSFSSTPKLPEKIEGKTVSYIDGIGMVTEISGVESKINEIIDYLNKL